MQPLHPSLASYSYSGKAVIFIYTKSLAVLRIACISNYYLLLVIAVLHSYHSIQYTICLYVYTYVYSIQLAIYSIYSIQYIQPYILTIHIHMYSMYVCTVYSVYRYDRYDSQLSSTMLYYTVATYIYTVGQLVYLHMQLHMYIHIATYVSTYSYGIYNIQYSSSHHNLLFYACSLQQPPVIYFALPLALCLVFCRYDTSIINIALYTSITSICQRMRIVFEFSVTRCSQSFSRCFSMRFKIKYIMK